MDIIRTMASIISIMNSNEEDIMDESKPTKGGGKQELNKYVSDISNWEALPYPVMIEIFSYLCDKDRVAMAQVCRNWYICFKSPTLWRERLFDLNGTSNEKFVEFTSLFGSCLQNVTIVCLHMYSNNRKDIAETMESLTENLKSAKLCQLNTWLLLSDVYSTNYSELMEKLTNCLIKLLQNQTKLKKVEFAGSHFSQPMGSELLNILAKSSGFRLEELNIIHFIQRILNVNDLNQLKQTLTKFTNLTSIAINYSYISDEVLRYWADSLRQKLKFIKISAFKKEPNNHVIRSETWKQIKASCPKLKVSISTSGIVHSSEIIRILQADIPLHNFNLSVTKENPLGDSSYLQTKVILKYLADCFHHRLVDINLFYPIKDNYVDKELVDVLERCRKLEKFSFFGVVNLLVLDKICDMMKDSQSVLRTVQIIWNNFNKICPEPEVGKKLNLIRALLPVGIEDANN